ncbi:unnamed protein product [Paramecium sonneborni]|uniref:Uncharacterized protein n=1 Tax=Paramecium sonneborni TaxID=65129 RepID=A0A8S1PRJ8_9CILI|nr:unnamed protein product [Paramecium sonneborni]
MNSSKKFEKDNHFQAKSRMKTQYLCRICCIDIEVKLKRNKQLQFHQFYSKIAHQHTKIINLIFIMKSNIERILRNKIRIIVFIQKLKRIINHVFIYQGSQKDLIIFYIFNLKIATSKICHQQALQWYDKALIINQLEQMQQQRKCSNKKKNFYERMFQSHKQIVQKPQEKNFKKSSINYITQFLNYMDYPGNFQLYQNNTNQILFLFSSFIQRPILYLKFIWKKYKLNIGRLW